MNLINKARSLRKNQTDVEQFLWKQLRNRHLFNYKFRRQFPIEPYIADFSSLELKLTIELDGGQHANRIGYDDQRSLFLQQRGFKVIRFWNNDVIENIEGVLEAIHWVILEITERTDISPHPTLSLRRGLSSCVHRLAVTVNGVHADYEQTKGMIRA